MSSFTSVTLKKLLPYESRYVTVGGSYRMHYIDEGQRDKPVVVLLHGNPTWCFYYRNLIEELRKEFRVIAPDHIGCGLSDHPTDAHFRTRQRVDHLEEFVQSLGLTKFSLVMHDWGGPLGTSLATRQMDSIERLVYLNTTLTEIESLPRIIKRAHTPFIGTFLTKYSMHFLKLMAEFGVAKRLPQEVKEGYFFPYRTIGRRTAIWDFVEDIPFESTHPSYPEMMRFAEKLPALSKLPVLILWGLKDPCFHREMLPKVAAHFPKARVVEIPDASHLVLEDKPEVVIPEILQFMRGDEPQVEQLDTTPGNALYKAFSSHVETLAHTDAVIEPDFSVGPVRYGHVTFRDLNNRINQYQRGLQELGLKAGDKVLMLVPAGVEFLALSYAVMGRGAIPVFVDPGMGKEKLLRCIADISPDAMIGTPKAQLLRLAKKKLFPRLKFAVATTDFPFSPFSDLSLLRRFSPAPLPEAPGCGTALIAFTSGATGTPKGVVFTDAMVTEELRIFAEEFNFESGTRDLPLLPIFSLFNLALGVCSVFPPMNPAEPLNLDPERIMKIVQDLGVASSFGSPTLWGKISEFCVRRSATFPSIKRILMAGAPVSEQVLTRVQGILPNGIAATPYGATEALPVTAVRAHEILNRARVLASSGEEGTFVGRPVRGVEVKIIDASDQPIATIAEARELPIRQVGEIIVRGQNVSSSYVARPDANRLSKIQDRGLSWHRMGDMGYLDEAGNLYFCGRKAHMVRTAERVYYSIPVERIFNQHPRVKRSALVRLSDSGAAGIVVEPHPHTFPQTENDRAQFIAELMALRDRSELATGIARFFFHPSFPVDSRHNAKIFRDKLGEWAEQQTPLDRAA
jgi:acyl-CoA synthetase (AMP-forming)/AMP-acid ligase II/pimeloyl-ACP methyl ester carboxylesterase